MEPRTGATAGCWRQIRRDRILETIMSTSKIDDATRVLVAQANASGGADNITVVLAQFLQTKAPEVEVDEDETLQVAAIEEEDDDTGEVTIPNLTKSSFPESSPANNRWVYLLGGLAILLLLITSVFWLGNLLKKPVSKGEALGVLESTRLEYNGYIHENMEMISTLGNPGQLLSDTVRINRWLDSADVAFRTNRFDKVVTLCNYARADFNAWRSTANAYLSRAVYDGTAIKRLVLNRIYASPDVQLTLNMPDSHSQVVSREELEEMSLPDMMKVSVSYLTRRADSCNANAHEIIDHIALQDSTQATRFRNTQNRALASFESARQMLLGEQITLAAARDAMQKADSSLSILCALERFSPIAPPTMQSIPSDKSGSTDKSDKDSSQRTDTVPAVLDDFQQHSI